MATTHMNHNRTFSPKRGKDVDMTQGNITKHLITFALPLLAGNRRQNSPARGR